MLRYGEAPDPTAGSGEVVVDIHAGQRQRGRITK